MFNIVLYQPEIPPNTGNIGRLCVGTNSILYLVGQLGFSLKDKALKRAGLDYWEHLSYFRIENLNELISNNKDKRFLYVTKFGKTYYHDFKYNKDDFLVFGSETSGLPKEIIKENFDNTLKIPMDTSFVRSLNLSNSVAIVLYEALRQIGFNDLVKNTI